MRLFVVSLAAVASLVAASASAADQPQSAPAPKKSGFDPNQVVCKQVGVTGSRLGGQRVCLTWAQWDEQSQADQQAMRDAVHRPGMSGVPTGFSPSGGGGGGGGMGGR